MAIRKTDKADLRKRYPIYIEVGLVLTLAILIVAFNLDLRPESEFEVVLEEQEIVEMEEVLQTKQEVKPPPPPRPPVPVEVPDDEILEDIDLDLDAALDIDEPLADLPPPPPPPSDEPEEVEPEIFMIVEEMPELIGGMEALAAKIIYPEIAKKAGVEGRVTVQFVVDEQGNVSEPTILRGVGAGLDEAAMNAVRQMKFTPGKQRGKAVKVKMSLPVTFRLR